MTTDKTNPSTPHVTVRFATEADVGLILEFIRALAEYERLSHEVVADEPTLHKTLFGEQKVAEVIIAECDREPAGFALFFHNFSTFLGRPGLYLEDIFVKPAYRNKGIGKYLLSFMARLAVERGCGRLEWWVLDWNETAIAFYHNLGAKAMDEWTVMRISGEALFDLAELKEPGQ